MIAIIDYNAGNIRSVQNALNRLGYESIITRDPDAIRSADKVVFPGVGEASSAMKYLKTRELDKLLVSLKQPVLGICLGMQLMCRSSEEGGTKCLGIFNVDVRRFSRKERVPHMGWNSFSDMRGELFGRLNLNNDMYFVHSYFAEIAAETTAICEYGIPFSAALQKGNFYGVQFHPEKSAEVGNRILTNFLEL